MVAVPSQNGDYSTRGIRALVVDDDKSHLFLTKLNLEKVDPRIEIDTANEAMEALVKMGSTRYDIIVTDHQMGATSGLNLVRIIKNNGMNIPIILYTGHGSEEIAAFGYNIGLDGYVMKTEDLRQYNILSNTIRSAVKKYDDMRQGGLDSQRAVNFAKTIGPRVKEYLQKNAPDSPVSVVSIGSGGVNFAFRLESYLFTEKFDVRPVMVRMNSLEGDLMRCKDIMDGTRMVAVDDGLQSGKTYNDYVGMVKRLVDDGRINLRKVGETYLTFVAENDATGLADFSVV